MKEMTQSALQSLYRSHPQAYFLIETVMHQALGNWETITEKIEIVDEERLSRAIRWQVRAADRSLLGREAGDREFANRYAPNHRFRFYGYKQVQAAVAPTTFVCRRCGYIVSLKKQIADGKLAGKDLVCPRCQPQSVLKQIVHIFGHPWCGEIAEIMPQRCSECKQPATLHLDNMAFGRSAWRCPAGHEPRMLSMLCPACGALGIDKRRMQPYAAGAAVKPAALTKVDISAAVDWEEVARRRLAIQDDSLREVILQQYAADPIAREAVQRLLDSSEAARRQMYEQFLESRPDLRGTQEALSNALGGEPDYNIQQLLAEYHGTDQAAEHSASSPLNAYLRGRIQSRFRLVPRYIANLPVLQMIYGYQVGTSRPAEAKVRTFDRGWESAVLAHRQVTEAGLFDLDPGAVVVWVNARHGTTLDVLALHKLLIRPEARGAEGAQIYADVTILLHTLAHLLIRQSELFTGLSRESLSEMIFPPAMAFAIFSAEGSELGALRSAFASYRLLDWLTQALAASRECAHDPVCVEGRITDAAACHACLFIAERRCNSYWNGHLDRRLVSNVRSNDGYWDD